LSNFEARPKTAKSIQVSKAVVVVFIIIVKSEQGYDKGLDVLINPWLAWPP
jgi:hypothetical protein